MLKQKEWIEVLVSKLNCTKKEAKAYFDCLFDSIKDQVSPENPVKVSGFGVFKIRKTAAKEQVNLVTGETVVVPEHNVLVFKPYFEIDPKPEAIEVEIDAAEVVAAEEAAAEAEEVVEAAAEEEEVAEDAAEEAVEETEEVAEEVEDDNIVWVFEGKECKTNDIKQVLKQKTTLSQEDIDASIDVVKKNVTAGKVEVKEEDDSFNFVVVK